MNDARSSILMIPLKYWEERLTAIFTGLLLYQYAVWLSDYWQSKTMLVVKAAFIIFVLLRVLLPNIRSETRFFIEWPLILASHFLILGLKDVHGNADEKWITTAATAVYDQFVHFHPYIWFALAASLAYSLAMWFVKVRWRIWTLLLSSVIVFAAFDSFSYVYLWKQAALIIFSGLVLLIVHHFGKIKRSDPSGWRQIADYPLQIAVFVVLLVGLVMFAGIIAPQARPIITDPYTAWKHMRGEQVNLGGKVVTDSSVPATASRSSVSGYSRDDSVLGGSFDYDYTPIMTVQTTKREYWRGESRTLYDGKGWSLSESEKNAEQTALQPGQHAQKTEQEKNNTVEVKQTFTFLQSDKVYPVIFGAYAIDQIADLKLNDKAFYTTADGLVGNLPHLLMKPGSGELVWPLEREYPVSYTIVSQVPVFDEAALRKAAQVHTEEAQWKDYVQLPQGLPARVAELARQATKDGATVYDKVKLLEDYLHANYTYTNSPNESAGKSDDFVDRFLFEIKEGYCDYFSTAMAVMLRTLDIPARWVKGYSSGQSSIDKQREELGIGMPQQSADPNGADTYTVRNSDAHSWVEVYFEGWGWIPFEPTAGFTMPVALPADEPEPVATPDDPVVETPAQQETAKPIAIGGIVSAALILVVAIVIFLRMFHILPPFLKLFEQKRALQAQQRVIAELNKFLRYAKRKGYRRQEHETVRETFAQWGNKNRWMSKDLDTLTGLFERAKYGDDEMSEKEASETSALIRKLRENM